MNSTPKYIYLDQNQWIYLSQAYHGDARSPSDLVAAQEVWRSVRDGVAVFPLSWTHFIETRRKRDLSARTRLAAVMTAISKGWAIAPRWKIIPPLLDNALAAFFGRVYKTQSPKIFGRGVPFAFGISDSLPQELNRRYSVPLSQAQAETDFLGTTLGVEFFLRGQMPDGSELPRRLINAFDARAEQVVQAFEQMRKEGRALDKTTRHRAHAFVEMFGAYAAGVLQDSLARLGITAQELFSAGTERAMALCHAVPVMDVLIELETERDKHWDRAIERNDYYDEEFLSVAIPFCDVVVTEHFWTSLATRKRLDRKYQTQMLPNLTALADYLMTLE